MKIHRSDLRHCHELHGAVVVIDVLRSFTTAADALARGARVDFALRVRRAAGGLLITPARADHGAAR